MEQGEIIKVVKQQLAHLDAQVDKHMCDFHWVVWERRSSVSPAAINFDRQVQAQSNDL
jgi:hypothetical protein